MTKRKPAIASKHAHGRRNAAKAQRTYRAVVRSPKDSVSTTADAVSTEPSPEHHDSLEQDVPVIDHAELLIKDPETTVRNDSERMENDSKKGVDFFSSANAKVLTYQAKLLEVAQANMQLAFEFAQRLAVIRSPAQFPSLIAEFTTKRIAMFRKHSTELTELSTKRWTS